MYSKMQEICSANIRNGVYFISIEVTLINNQPLRLQVFYGKCIKLEENNELQVFVPKLLPFYFPWKIFFISDYYDSLSFDENLFLGLTGR